MTRGPCLVRTRHVRLSAGFTLVEMLIALVLLSVLMLVLTSALRGMGQVEARVEQRIEAADDWRATQALLADVLGRVSGRMHAVQQAGDATRAPFFEAGPDHLAWIGVMPARFGLGGRHYLRLGLERIASGDAYLVLRYAPWNGEPGFAAWSQAQSQVLAGPVGALSLQYLEPLSGQWSPVWPPPDVPIEQLPPGLLPAAVALSIDGLAPAWPPLLLAVGATFASSGSVVQADFGGTR